MTGKTKEVRQTALVGGLFVIWTEWITYTLTMPLCISNSNWKGWHSLFIWWLFACTPQERSDIISDGNNVYLFLLVWSCELWELSGKQGFYITQVRHLFSDIIGAMTHFYFGRGINLSFYSKLDEKKGWTVKWRKRNECHTSQPLHHHMAWFSHSSSQDV